MFRTVVMSLLLASGPLFGADVPADQKPAEPVVEKYEDWVSRCVEPADGKTICEAIQVILINRDQVSGRVLETSLRRLNDKDIIMQFVLPFGVDLRPGVAFRVDENEELKAGFLTCLQQGCLVQLLVNNDLMSQLKGGTQARLGFRPLGSAETVVVEISLRGFSSSIQGL